MPTKVRKPRTSKRVRPAPKIEGEGENPAAVNNPEEAVQAAAAESSVESLNMEPGDGNILFQPK